MKRICYWSIFFIFCSLSLFSQTFSVFDADASSFPTIKAKFFAFDASGNHVTPSINDLSVTENGIGREITSISCPQVKNERLSIVFAVDVTIYNNIDNAKNVLLAWLELVKLGMNEAAIMTYDGNSYINQDFTDKKDRLIAAVNSLKTLSSSEDHTGALIRPTTGAISIAKNAKYKPVVVVLSSCSHFNESKKLNIIAEAQKNNTTVNFVIFDRYDWTVDICKEIAYKTGGFSNNKIHYNDLETAKASINRILDVNHYGSPCEISWESGISCFSGDRKSEVKWNNLTTAITYPAPSYSVAKIEIEPQYIRFTNVAPGTTKDTIITITAINSDFDVTDIISSNPHFSISPTNFNLKNGESKSLTLSFKPVDSSYSFGRIEVQNNLCNTSLFVSGGFTGRKITNNTLKLTHPNGGEVFLAGSDTVITWEGVLPSDTVSLEYSLDSGKTWNLITDKATGLRYRWEGLPKVKSKTCLLKIQLGIQCANIQKEISLDGHSSYVSCVAWSPNGDIIASSSWDKTIKLWDTKTYKCIKTLTGHTEFINAVSWNPSGTQLASASDDSTIMIWDINSGICIYILKGHKDKVLSVSWSPLGDMIASGSGGWSSNDNTIKLWETNNFNLIKVINGHNNAVSSISWNMNGDKFASGSIDKTIKIWDLNSNLPLDTFIHNDYVWSIAWNSMNNTIISGSGNNTYYKSGKVSIWDIDKKLCIKNIDLEDFAVRTVNLQSYGELFASGDEDIKVWDSRTYECLDTLHGIGIRNVNSISWDPFCDRLVSGWEYGDIFIWELGKYFLQYDISDSLWSIVTPELISLNIDMGKCIVGDVKDSVIIKFLENPGTYPIRIDSIMITGKDPSQFSLVSGIPPFIIEGGKDKAVEFSFKPVSGGIKNAKIEIYTQSDTLKQTITGEGVDKKIGIMAELIDFGKVMKNTSKDTLCAIIKNVSGGPLTITKTELIGPDTSQFKILQNPGSFALSNNEEKVLKLQFSPKYFGRTCCDIGFLYSGDGSPAKAQLFGEGVGIPALIRLPDTTAEVGTENYIIPIYAKFLYDTSMTDLGFKAELRLNALAFLPKGKSANDDIINNERVITINGKVNSLETNERVIAEIEGLVLFPDYKNIPIYLSDFSLDNDDIDPRQENGKLNLEACAYNLTKFQFFNTPSLTIIPDFATNEIEINFDGDEEGLHSICIYNIQGVRIDSREWYNSKNGRQSFKLDLKNYSSGIHYVVLKTPWNVVSKLFINIK